MTLVPNEIINKRITEHREMIKLAYNVISIQVYEQIRGETENRVRDQIYNHIWGQMRDSVHKQIQGQISIAKRNILNENIERTTT